MKRIQLLVNMSGTRNGQKWPAFKSVVELPKTEAEDLIKVGSAVETDEKVTHPDFGSVKKSERATRTPPENAAANERSQAN